MNYIICDLEEKIMVDFSVLPLNSDLKKELSELHIDYAFQPIFYPDGKTVFAREALMRPADMSVSELIEKYENADKLHVLEVATMFGAVLAYQKRGYSEYVTINSFPSECMTEEEEDAFNSFFGDTAGKGIIEVLEYTVFDLKKWEIKRDSLRKKNIGIALDDFGTGSNNVLAIDIFAPRLVKLDRSFISNIDSDVIKQERYFYYVHYMHRRGAKVLAEGVETKEEFEFLVDNEIDYLQGFYFARPE